MHKHSNATVCEANGGKTGIHCGKHKQRYTRRLKHPTVARALPQRLLADCRSPHQTTHATMQYNCSILLYRPPLETHAPPPASDTHRDRQTTACTAYAAVAAVSVQDHLKSKGHEWMMCTPIQKQTVQVAGPTGRRQQPGKSDRKPLRYPHAEPSLLVPSVAGRPLRVAGDSWREDQRGRGCNTRVNTPTKRPTIDNQEAAEKPVVQHTASGPSMAKGSHTFARGAVLSPLTRRHCSTAAAATAQRQQTPPGVCTAR